jgi:hypothetical protein
MIREIKEQAGQDFFLSGNSRPNSLKPEMRIITPNAKKKANVNGFAAQVLQERKELIRYQIMATETRMLVRYATTLNNDGEPFSDIKIPEVILSRGVLYSLEQLSWQSVSRKRVQSDVFKNATLFYYC